MAALNSVHLIGNLTRDPEVRYTTKSTAVCEISLAINRKIPGVDGAQARDEVTFVDVTLWGKTAELAGQYLRKGAPIFIDGRLQVQTWEDKDTGKNRSKMIVVGESMQFLGGKRDDSEPREDRREDRRYSNDAPKPAKGGNYGKPHGDEEDSIPF